MTKILKHSAVECHFHSPQKEEAVTGAAAGV
jgi:hypothetical protein